MKAPDHKEQSFYAQVAYNTEAAIFSSVQVLYFCYLQFFSA